MTRENNITTPPLEEKEEKNAKIPNFWEIILISLPPAFIVGLMSLAVVIIPIICHFPEVEILIYPRSAQKFIALVLILKKYFALFLIFYGLILVLLIVWGIRKIPSKKKINSKRIIFYIICLGFFIAVGILINYMLPKYFFIAWNDIARALHMLGWGVFVFVPLAGTFFDFFLVGLLSGMLHSIIFYNGLQLKARSKTLIYPLIIVLFIFTFNFAKLRLIRYLDIDKTFLQTINCNALLDGNEFAQLKKLTLKVKAYGEPWYIMDLKKMKFGCVFPASKEFLDKAEKYLLKNKFSFYNAGFWQHLAVGRFMRWEVADGEKIYALGSC